MDYVELKPADFKADGKSLGDVIAEDILGLPGGIRLDTEEGRVKRLVLYGRNGTLVVRPQYQTLEFLVDREDRQRGYECSVTLEDDRELNFFLKKKSGDDLESIQTQLKNYFAEAKIVEVEEMTRFGNDR